MPNRKNNSKKIETEHADLPGKTKDTPKQGKKDRLKRLNEHLNMLAEQKFTGYIKINFSQGAIGRVEKFEEVLRENK